MHFEETREALKKKKMEGWKGEMKEVMQGRRPRTLQMERLCECLHKQTSETLKVWFQTLAEK